jgi:hypothetical protein
MRRIHDERRIQAAELNFLRVGKVVPEKSY